MYFEWEKKNLCNVLLGMITEGSVSGITVGEFKMW